MEACLAQAEFAEALLFTHLDTSGTVPDVPEDIRIVPIDQLRSSEAYSQFILSRLVDHIRTEHCLIVQWDGHIADASQWDDAFLDYDYIGASWPQFDDGHEVGNGGFSLRSRRLLEACRADGFKAHHPEDIAIGRTNRDFLEAQGMTFAPVELANRFAAERAGDPDAAFGYHGVFLMPHVLGGERFWSIFRNLDDRATLRPDFKTILRAVAGGKGGIRRAISLAARRVLGLL
ncbi:hypothetical protein CD351_04480 [Erythrobacter sp. KY5]|nr:hypothetical protein CD351_04480 [Erythrobacter sp. KY5]